MSRAALREELERGIGELGAKIAADEKKLLQGGRADKVAASGEIAALRGRQAELRARLADLERHRGSESAWEKLKTSLEQDLLDLDTAFQRWARKYS